MDVTKITDLFPSRKFLIEVDFDMNNDTAAKLLESVIKGTELLTGLTVTKIYPKVATIDSIDKNEAKEKINAALKYLDDVKNCIEDSLIEYQHTELEAPEYGVIQKFKQF